MNASPGGAVWLGMRGAQWLAICGAVFIAALLWESLLGDLRRGFGTRMQYLTYVLGVALLASLALTAALPHSYWLRLVLQTAGWAAIVLAVIGTAFHYYYAVIRKPGGRRWLLYNLMYHAPLFAPLGLATAGATGLIVAASLAGNDVAPHVNPSRATAIVVAASLVGLMMQIAVLHYRGAYNNPLMYAPLVLPLGAVVGGIWIAAAASPMVSRVYVVGLWITFLTAFVGLGMHLRGLDRMMGGLYVALPNVLEGPPPVAPLLMALLALQGIIGVRLL